MRKQRGAARDRQAIHVSFATRYRIFCVLVAAALLGLVGALLAEQHLSATAIVAILAVFGFLLIFIFLAFYESSVRPLQTLSNVVSALREEDYSFRARGAHRDDVLGELAREINALADMLQSQRLKALEAIALLQRVMAEMDAPVLAFDHRESLRLLNPAAERAFRLSASRDIGKSAGELGLLGLLAQPQEGIWQQELNDRTVRWMVRRSRFRQRGAPHLLLLLSDVSLALREEEQQAWKRLIRVLGHEISNSLTPIKSIAGSLRLRSEAREEFERGLSVIESRAESLHRFVESYRQLAQLPSPTLQRVALAPLLQRVAQLETRSEVRIVSLAEMDLQADPDQLEQLFINLVRNAVEAASREEECGGENVTPEVTIASSRQGGLAVAVIADNGPGLANETNLFVPFYTTKKSGSGVGLALARQIAEAHGGSLELRNRRDVQGCEAVVRLPLQAASLSS
ncbi:MULTISPECIES: ATP-binding protein [Acidobacterium]|uniref:histidine kinase n=1 Tax=Acidobacterium capsulatum (strain ATCC 51196 / DSM 11244 / BCRC 80197 / JCM 7670 / NBRC 15755 / NCIMB 13165 / 161) TaxID=240015 RepID=C1F1W2_ACIC5|nr:MULTISPECIES: ATP-binding protein [Acidobacterium]ACO34559.1 sensor histidine kinase [Acidobacterium capsulatum ATCC 51196]HCT61240.1 HAMP domain-containing protein [Acidobacterium sp.]